MSDSDPLASWRPGPAKDAILAFVRSVTEPGDSFVPPGERIAAFDNDGTSRSISGRGRDGCPLLAGRNSDGDIEMLASARFGLLVHHDDAEREFAYDVGAERALAKAAADGWTVASMRSDFVDVF